MVSKDISEILEDCSALGLQFNLNLFIGKEPTNPRNCVTIFDTPGFPPTLTLDQATGYEYPSIQIRVRNASYESAFAIAQDIMDVLHGLTDSKNGVSYVMIRCTNGPFLLDWDENNNARFVVNFNIQRIR